MNELHSLLKRQLRRFTGETKPFREDYTDLLQSINDAYWQFDADRRMLEHSLELTSQELLERNAELSRTNAELEMRVAARTAELSRSEARFRGLFEHAPVSIWEEDFSAVRQYIDDLRGAGVVDFSAYFDSHPRAVAECAARVKIVDVNHATLEMYQAESKAQLLTNLSKVLGAESLIPFKAELVALTRGDMTIENETINYTLRGESRAIFLRLTVAPGYEETWAKVFVGISDITERRQAEAALAAERDLLQTLMDNVPDTIYFKDTFSCFTRINRAQARVLGLATPEEAIGKRDLDFQDADLAQTFYEEEQHIVESGEPLINRIEFNPTSDGQPRWFSATKVPIKDEAGRVIGIVGVSRDITQRRQAEEALQQSEAEMRALFAAMDDVIIVYNREFRYVQIAPTSTKLMYAPPKVMLGKTVFEVLPSAVAKTFYDAIQEVLQTRQSIHVEYQLEIAGQAVWKDAIVTPRTHDTVFWIEHDITARKRAEEALHQSEEKYRLLIERLPAITYISAFDEAKTRLYVSPQNEKYLGFTPAEWLADPDLWRNQLHPDDQERVLAEAARFYETGEPFISEYRALSRDGRFVWFHDEAVIIKDAEGQPQYIQGVKVNITKQKQAEEALRQSEERFRLMSWATKDAVWDWDLRTNQIWWGEGLQKMFHYSSETLQTDTEWRRAHIHPEDRGKVDRTISQALEGGMEFWSKEYRFQRVDSLYANIMDRGYILRNNAGEPYRMIGAMMDITERKQAEQALLESEARYRQIVETAGDIIYRADTRGRLTYVNPTALHIMGYDAEAEVVGRHYLEFVHPAWRNRIKNTYNRQFVEKIIHTYQEFVVLTRTRDEIWLGQTVQLVMENGRVTGFQAIARDITERRQAEETVHRQNIMLSKLHQITLGLLKHHDMDRLLNKLVELSAELLEAPYSEIMLIEGEALVVKAVTQNQPLLLGKRLERKDALLSWQAFDTRRPAVLADYATWPNRQKHYEGFPLHAVADFPILNDDQCLGVLALGRDIAGYDFNPDQIQFGLLFASLTAIVINNAQLREALREQSIRDPLTGLFNRRYMEETLKREISRVTRQLHPLGIIMLDIDHFKRFNDTLGHAAGDALLRELGRFLKSHVRVEDIACRYGGEEFILIMPDASLEAVQQRAEYLRREVARIHVEEGGLSYGGITLSLGVAVYPQHGRTIESVLLAADGALYSAKKEGRNRTVIAKDAT